MPSSKVSGVTYIAVFSVFAILFGATMLVVGVSGVTTANDVMSWPSTEGTVMGTYVTESYESTGGKHPSWYWYYVPHVSYVYSVNGITYQSEKIWYYNSGSTSSAWAQNVADSYTTGQTVVLYYKPSDPSQAVLDKGNLDSMPLFPLAIGLSSLAGGVAGVTYYFTRGRKKEAALKESRNAEAAAYPAAPHKIRVTRNDAEAVRWEPILWEGRPEKAPYLIVFPEQTILVSVSFIVFSCAFLTGGLVMGVLPLVIIAVLFLIIGGVSLAFRMRSSARKLPRVRYVLTTGHLLIEGGQFYTAYLEEDLGKNGLRNLQLTLDAARRAREDVQVRYIDLTSLTDLKMRATLGQTYYKVGSIYAAGDRLPLIECVKEPEKVLKLIQEAAWKAAREGAGYPAPEPPL